MVGSRIHKIGSIFERVSGLLETGVIKHINQPIWFEVYKHHPPKYNPRFDRPALNIQIKPILYEEDVLRVKIHKLEKNDVHNLNDDYKKKKVELCQELMDTGLPLVKAVSMLKKVEVEKPKHESTIFEDFQEMNDKEEDDEEEEEEEKF